MAEPASPSPPAQLGSPKPRARAFPCGVCYCGCGESLASPTRFFLPGHDKRALDRVIKERYGNVASFLLAQGYGPHRRSG